MKIFIFGPSGAGKSTVAKKISKMYNVSHFDLDEIFWKFEKGVLNPEKRNETVGKILKNDNWLIEGMYNDDWISKLIAESDFVFAYVPSKFINYWRILRRTLPRILRISKHERPSDFTLIKYLFGIVRKFHMERLPKFLALARENSKEVFIVKNGNELIKLLKEKLII